MDNEVEGYAATIYCVQWLQLAINAGLESVITSLEHLSFELPPQMGAYRDSRDNYPNPRTTS